MMTQSKRVGLVLAFMACCGASRGLAADQGSLNWAEKMFSHLNIDFGTVARGADVRLDLVLTNLYEEDVTVVDVDTTCGCTAATPNKSLLKTHEKAIIDVVMNTKKFMHRKDSNVDVTLRFHGAQGTSTKTVRVPVTAYIRSDVVLEPGNVDFGTVAYGEGAEQTINIAYAGRDDWKIQNIRVGHEDLEAQLDETSRGGGRVDYTLTVRLDPDAEMGPIHDQFVIVTDDEKSPEVPLLVTGRVAPDIEILPAEFKLGTLAPGESRQFNVVVKGKRPFLIENIECDAHPDCFKIKPLAETTKTVHVVPFRMTAPTVPGDFQEVFTVTIDGREEPLSFPVNGTIVSGS